MVPAAGSITSSNSSSISSSSSSSSKSDTALLVMQNKALREISLKTEFELLSLREFTSLENEALRLQLQEEKTALQGLLLHKETLERRISELEVLTSNTNDVARYCVNDPKLDDGGIDKENVANEFKKLSSEHRQLQIESSQNKAGYDLLKEYCLSDLKNCRSDRIQLQADADRVVSLVDC